MNKISATSAELLFLKYKGIPSPWELLSQAKRFGFKCKKYANWPEVHVTKNSRQILKEVGDSLIDSDEVNISLYPEITQIWEKVQRWAKDKERYSLEPDFLPEYEKLARLIDIGSKTPNVVDQIIDDFGFISESIDISDRWTIFLSISIYEFFQSKKRYEYVVNLVKDFELNKKQPTVFIDSIGNLVKALYLSIGLNTSTFNSKEIVLNFISKLGITSEPLSTERVSGVKASSIPKVWIEKYDGTQLELVRFEYSEGNIYVRVNRANRVFSNSSELSPLLSNDTFWKLIGKSIETQISQIDEIQDFFNIFARHLRAITK